VDFLHQFLRPVVSKEDKTLPWRALRLRFCAAAGFAGGVFHIANVRRATENTLDLIRGAVSDRSRSGVSFSFGPQCN
jgi:hypothetical protein